MLVPSRAPPLTLAGWRHHETGPDLYATPSTADSSCPGGRNGPPCSLGPAGPSRPASSVATRGPGNALWIDRTTPLPASLGFVVVAPACLVASGTAAAAAARCCAGRAGRQRSPEAGAGPRPGFGASGDRRGSSIPGRAPSRTTLGCARWTPGQVPSLDLPALSGLVAERGFAAARTIRCDEPRLKSSRTGDRVAQAASRYCAHPPTVIEVDDATVAGTTAGTMAGTSGGEVELCRYGAGCSPWTTRAAEVTFGMRGAAAVCLASATFALRCTILRGGGMKAVAAGASLR